MPIRLQSKASKTVNVLAVLDSGCASSVMPAIYVANIEQWSSKLFTANGSQLKVDGLARVKFQCCGVNLNADVIYSSSGDEVLLGVDWLT